MRPSRALPLRRATTAAITTAATLLAAGALGAPAANATITVGSCFFSPENRIDSWTPSASPSQPVQFHDHCGDGSPHLVGTLETTGTFGFTATTPAPNPPLQAQPGRVVGYTVTAPTGTTIDAVRLYNTLSVANASWAIQVKADDAVLKTCAGPTTDTLCGDGTTESLSNGFTVPAGTTTFDIAAYCMGSVPCDYAAGNEPTFSTVLVGGEIDLGDPFPPSAAVPVIGGRVGGKLTTAGTVTASGTDTLGLQRLEVRKNGIVLGSAAGTCVEWSLRPCADASVGANTTLSKSFTIGELGLAAGSHTLRTRAIDAGGLVTESAPITIVVDETVLPAVSLSGGGRSNEAQRQFGWIVPPSANAESARVELCPVATPTKCQFLAAEVDGPLTFYSDAYPDVVARVQLSGPGGAFAYSDPLRFTWDTTAPKQPRLSLLKDSGEDRLVEFTMDPNDTDVVRYKAKLCTMPANKCAELPGGEPSSTGPTQITQKITQQGLYRLDITAVDAAGNLSLPGQLSLHYNAPPIELIRKDQPLALVPKLPTRLPKSSIVVRGVLQAGAAAKVTVTLAGRNTKRKAVKVVKAAKVGANGTFAVRIALPKKLNRKQGLLVTMAATPTKGYLPVTVRKRVRG